MEINLSKANPDYIFETDYWVVLLSWKLVYLRLIIFSKQDKQTGKVFKRLSDLPDEYTLDFHNNICKPIETSLLSVMAGGIDNNFVANWGCYTNDAYDAVVPNPQVHYHFRARHRYPVTLGSFIFEDTEFGGIYKRGREKSGDKIDGTPEQRHALIQILQPTFNQNSGTTL